MRTTIGSGGRLVIPSDMRSAAGLEPGAAVEVELRDGLITIAPAATDVTIVKRGRLRVAVAREGQEALEQDLVREVRDQVRERR